jgi:predicted membrane chloride channel (bestrophin family)
MIILSMINDSEKNHFQIAISTQGLGFITMVVAFLLVSRVNIALGRFNEARGNLEILYRETRELVQNVCVLSNHDTSDQAKAWRHELSYRLLLLLRTSMAVIDFPTDFIAAWDIPELKGEELEDIKNVLTGPYSKRWAHAERGEWENTIHAQDKRLQVPMVTAHENKLLASVDTFMSGYYGIRKFLTTPVPFPLVQMARTFLVWYIFSIPFAMLTDKTSSHFSRCAIVFLITFGESLHESCSF